MFCRKCGAKNPDGAAFCGSCGTPLNQAAPGNTVQNAGAQPDPGNAVQNAGAQPQTAKKPSRLPLGVAAAVVVLAVLVLFSKGHGKDKQSTDDLPPSPVQDSSTTGGESGGNDTENGDTGDGYDTENGDTGDGNGTETGDTGGGNGTENGDTGDGYGTEIGDTGSSTPSGLTGEVDSSGYITLTVTDLNQQRMVLLNDEDLRIVAKAGKNVTSVSNGLTYYWGYDRLTPFDVDTDTNLIVKIPEHWVYIGGMTPYTIYVGDSFASEGEYVAYALVNDDDAFLSVITDWNTYINLRGYYTGDLSSGTYNSDTLYEFYSSDQVVLLLMTSEGMWGYPCPMDELSASYQPITAGSYSEISVQYVITDIYGQRYRTPYETWK